MQIFDVDPAENGPREVCQRLATLKLEKKIVRKNHRRFHKDGKGFVLLTPPEVFIMMRFLRRIAWDCCIIDEPFQMIHQKSEVGARLRWL